MKSHVASAAEETDDGEIVRRVLQGQVDEFETLLVRYRGYVMKIVSGFLPAEAVADFAQDIFVEVFKSLPAYGKRHDFKNWLAGLTIRRCYDYWRHHYRNMEIPASALTEDHAQWVEKVATTGARDAFSQSEAQAEARDLLQWAMAALSAKDRMVLTLVYLEGFSVKEAAGLLGWSPVNVKVRAHRSRMKLKQRIAAMLEGDG